MSPAIRRFATVRRRSPICSRSRPPSWDVVGSEFAGRHMLYEKFYAGNSIIVRNQSDREAPWTKFHAIVDNLLDRIDTPCRDSTT
jgi:hypothetical protein